MINNVSNYGYYTPAFGGSAKIASSAVALHQNDVENLVKFVNGQPITTTPEISIKDTITGTLPFVAIFGGIQAGGEIKKNGWSIKKTIENVNAASQYTTRSQALSAAKNEVAKKFKDVLKKNVAVDSSRGFIGKILDKIPGYKALRSSGFGQMMSNKGTGAGWMAVIDGAIETFTQVIPAFQQGGAEAGFKQIAKSGAKVVAGTAGFVAGDVAGRAIGAAIGTAICPGIGTAIGSFLGGFIGGVTGSAIAGKATQSLIGKSEVEKIQEKQTAEAAQQVNADPETKKSLALQSLEYANQILAQDPENAEALAAKASAEKILSEIAATEQVQQPVQTTQAYNPYQQPNYVSMYGIPTVPGFNGVSYDLDVYRQGLKSASAISGKITNPFEIQKQQNQTQAIA